MPLFMIEREYAEQLNPTPEIARFLEEVNVDAGVRWLYSFLSSDRRKTYCVYEAPNPEALREAARQAGIPADAIVELTGKVMPSGVVAAIESGG